MERREIGREIGDDEISNHPDPIRSLSIEVPKYLSTISISLDLRFEWQGLSRYCRVRGEWKLVHAWNTLDRGRDRWVAWRSKGEIWGKWLADILSNACTPLSPPRFLGAVAFVAIDADSAGKLIENRCSSSINFQQVSRNVCSSSKWFAFVERLNEQRPIF